MKTSEITIKWICNQVNSINLWCYKPGETDSSWNSGNLEVAMETETLFSWAFSMIEFSNIN